MSRSVRIRYFASVREAIGLAEEMFELPSELVTVGMMRQCLSERSNDHAHALATERSIRVAINHVLCQDDAAIVSCDAEVAFFPPVTGG